LARGRVSMSHCADRKVRAFAKTLLYAGLILCLALLAYGFWVEHSRVVGQAAGASRSRMLSYLGGFLGAALALGLVCGRAISRFLGRRVERWFLRGGRPRLPPPDLEAAERLRVKGAPLEAIRELREYLERHPDELQVMGRIAEIYRYDLNNELAAALEYEQLLRHKLPPEQWGWAALHLAKLYGGLNHPDKALALLERLETEYGQTLAARRARQRLAKHGLMTGGSAPE